MALARIVQINCLKPEGRPDEVCKKCRLPLAHHGVQFQVLKFDDVYDVYSLHGVAKGERRTSLPLSTRMLVLHVSGLAFSKFKEYA